MKLHGTGGSWASSPVAQWQLEEVQVFWAKGEQGLALGLLRQMTDNLEEKAQTHLNVTPLIFVKVSKTQKVKRRL